VVAAGEQETYSHRIDALRALFWSDVDPNAERLQHIGAPTNTGCCPIAVLGDGDTCSCSDECRSRRDIEHLEATTTRAAGIEEGRPRGFYL
jgi:hypothetical protein